MSNNFIEEEVKYRDSTLKIGVLPVYNGFIILVSDMDLSLGSISIGAPKTNVFSLPSFFSIIGKKNQQVANIISERFANKTEKLVLSIIRLEHENIEIIQLIIEEVEKIISNL
ncbi:MAG: hypothetical protein ACTSUV_06485 [Candidatus Ranarchaeia archaeon]